MKGDKKELIKIFKNQYGHDIMEKSEEIIDKLNSKNICYNGSILQKELIKQGYTIGVIGCNQILDILLYIIKEK